MMFIAIGVNVVTLLLLFGVMSKLEDMSQVLKRMAPEPAPEPEAAKPGEAG